MDIQVGDRVTYKIREIIYIKIMEDSSMINKLKNDGECKILKIERPKYEVVEEKKELLTEEEREFLKLYMKINNIKASKLIFNIFEITFIDGNISFTAYINTDYSFRKLIYNKEYTLKELGLEEN